MTRLFSEYETYRTGDLVLAAALALFYPLEALDRNDPFVPQWVFCRDADLDTLVEPQAFYRQLRILERQPCRRPTPETRARLRPDRDGVTDQKKSIMRRQWSAQHTW